MSVVIDCKNTPVINDVKENNLLNTIIETAVQAILDYQSLHPGQSIDECICNCLFLRSFLESITDDKIDMIVTWFMFNDKDTCKLCTKSGHVVLKINGEFVDPSFEFNKLGGQYFSNFKDFKNSIPYHIWWQLLSNGYDVPMKIKDFQKMTEKVNEIVDNDYRSSLYTTEYFKNLSAYVFDKVLNIK